MIRNWKIAAVLVMWLQPLLTINAQPSVRLLADQSEISISGTSNLHDWEEQVENFKVNLNIQLVENELKSINHVHVTMQSGSIVSDNNIMTNKTHEALNVKKYPQIEFKLISVDKLSADDGRFSGTLIGDVTLAGVTKRISLAFSGVHSGNKITIKGSKQLNMNDFKIEPPKALMGTLKTGEDVTISFSLNFQVT